MTLFHIFLTWLFDGYMYFKYTIIIPLSNYLYPTEKTSITTQPFTLPNGTPAFTYMAHQREFISLFEQTSADDLEFSPIVNVLIKARDGTMVHDPILKEAIVKLGGPQGDFGQKNTPYTIFLHGLRLNGI